MTPSEQAIDIGTINAITAIDQRHEYADSRASYRQNVLDTLDEQGLAAHRNEAISAYDDHIRQNWPNPERIMHMQTIHLNIGLNIAGIETLQMPQIAVALEQALPGMEIRESYIRQSATERTACIILRWAGTYDTFGRGIMHLCDLLSQEAIAGKWFEPGAGTIQFLLGPKAEARGGEFNEDYWLVPCPDNAPVAADEAVAALANYDSHEGWTICGKSGLMGWFERDSDGTGGGLWFSLENDGFLHLIDYDGVFALPRPVLIALRLAGVSVDSSFE